MSEQSTSIISWKTSRSFLVLIWSWEHLTVTEAVTVTLIGLDVCHCDRFNAPSMINQDFSVDAEGFIEVFFIPLCPSCDIAHCEHVRLLEQSGFPVADLPEVGERFVIPKEELIRVLIEFPQS